MKKTLSSLLAIASVAVFAQNDILAVVGNSDKTVELRSFELLNSTHLERGVTLLNANENLPKHVVAMTLDNKTQDMLFIGMNNPDVYAYNLQSKRVTKVYNAGQFIPNCSMPMHFSRMTTTPDGVSYALNNNGTSLLEIKSNGSSYHVNDLGAVAMVNSDKNFTSIDMFGGDMIADTDGMLFLITAKNNVLKINPANRMAEFLGTITGLPNMYTSNGAAVLSDGRILLGNASGKGFYVMSINDLTAKSYGSSNLNSAFDLASPYFLKGEASLVNTTAPASLYPTKVTEREVFVSYNTAEKANAVLRIYDYHGTEVLKQNLVFDGSNNSIRIALNNLKAGNYYATVVTDAGKEILNQKFIFLR
ncbi:MAG: hypothetical protein Q4F57_06645 [Weeksellaceae bacterium]|nr:hypothetical protein [Weeksellaceae bacterium]